MRREAIAVRLPRLAPSGKKVSTGIRRNAPFRLKAGGRKPEADLQ
jgi:hypothetical protein